MSAHPSKNLQNRWLHLFLRSKPRPFVLFLTPFFCSHGVQTPEQPQRLLLRGKTYSTPLLRMPGRCCFPWDAPCVVVPSAYRPFSLRASGRGVSVVWHPLSLAPSHLLWHHRCGVIQAAISEAASDLCNLPGLRLYTERELKRSLIVVRIPVWSDGLE